MTRSPVVPRRRLGSELRSLREASGKTIEEAAAALECSSAKISRLETGKGVPKNRDVRDLLRLYGVDDDELAGRLFALATEGQSQGWWEDYKDLAQETGTEYVGRYVALEQEATSIHRLRGRHDPRICCRPPSTPMPCWPRSPRTCTLEQRERMVELRMKRQAILRERAQLPPLRLRVSSSGEPAILRPVGSHQDHATATAGDSGTSRRAVGQRRPAGDAARGGPHAGLGSPFSIVHFERRQGSRRRVPGRFAGRDVPRAAAGCRAIHRLLEALQGAGLVARRVARSDRKADAH